MNLCVAAVAWSGNWPGWRGPETTGVAQETSLPQSWSTNENVKWHVSLPGPGNSSPIVWGDKVFVTQFVKAENRRTVMCFNRADGKLLWQSGVTYAEEEPTQQSNPYCAATPVTDGERVIALFGSAGLYCYDFNGKELWHRDLGKMNHMFGSGASPILHGDLCFVNFGPDEKARLIAVSKKDGSTVWEAEPPKVDPSEMPPMRGPGGRGGFGPGMMLAGQMVSQGDKNADKKLSREEMAALAGAWFDKLDNEKTEKITQQQMTERLSELLPPPQGMGPGGPGPGPGGADRPPQDAGPGPGGPPPGGGRGGFSPGGFIAPGLFSASDVDKDGSLTKAELKTTFDKWFAGWDKDKTGFVTEDQVREGLNAALPRPQFGGPGGGGPGGAGGPGGGRGPGGRGGGAGSPSGSWSTPIIVKAGDHDELVVNFPARLVGYDPATGKQLWVSKGLGATIYTTPLAGEATLVATSSDMNGGNALALKPGGIGDVTESRRVWRLDRVKGAIGSGVIHDGHIYTIDRDGIVACFDLKTGEKVMEERLKGSGSRTSSWSSMLLANGKIYVPNQSGDVFVLRASPKFEVLSTNTVPEPTNASLAASNGEIFMRTDKGLWCFAEPK